jgi:hypothetical protein
MRPRRDGVGSMAGEVRIYDRARVLCFLYAGCKRAASRTFDTRGHEARLASTSNIPAGGKFVSGHWWPPLVLGGHWQISRGVVR